MYDLTTLDGTIVSFLNYGTGSAIDVTENDPTDGTPLIGYQFHGGENQQWKLEKIDDGPVWPIWKLKSVKTGTYADLNNGASTDGTKAQIWGSTGVSKNQAWRLISADPIGRVVMIQNVSSGTFLDLYHGDATNATKIQGWQGTVESQNPHQLWRVLRMK